MKLLFADKKMEKQEILDVISKFKLENRSKYGIIEMGVFGSVTNNYFDEYSDIDIYVKTEIPKPYFLVEIKDSLEQLLHRKVDIVRYRENMNQYLKRHIQSEGMNV